VELGYRPASGYMRVTLAAISVSVLAIGLSCPSQQVQTPPANVADNHDDIVLFFTGDALGALKPCGCSGGQLGGLEKRASIFSTVPKASRLIADTGGLVQGDNEQDLIKFRIMFEGFRLLDYDLVHLSPKDREIAANLSILNDADKPFDVITAAGQDARVPQSFTKRFTVKGRTITVNVATLSAQGGRIDQATALFPDGDAAMTINILILGGYEGRAAQDILSEVPLGIGCVICPSDSDEPRLLSEPGASPLAFAVGRFGRHVSRVGVTVPLAKGQVTLRLTDVPVAEKLPADEALVQLYRTYQQLVKDSNLLEKYPRIPMPQEGVTFVGSKTCARCHEFEQGKWSEQAHAGAFATLQKVSSDRDPECVICHVVGMEYSGGFVTEEQTPHLKDVGCEVCHGPGSHHVQTPGQVWTEELKKNCLSCHTPEHSGEYAGHEEEFMKKIVHWREP
jgi:hypothetical protein